MCYSLLIEWSHCEPQHIRGETLDREHNPVDYLVIEWSHSVRSPAHPRKYMGKRAQPRVCSTELGIEFFVRRFRAALPPWCAETMASYRHLSLGRAATQSSKDSSELFKTWPGRYWLCNSFSSWHQQHGSHQPPWQNDCGGHHPTTKEVRDVISHRNVQAWPLFLPKYEEEIP